MAEGKGFRGAVMGGFNRHEVMRYIESLVREHKEEIDAYRSGAELLRRERDDARRQVAELEQKMGGLGVLASELEVTRARGDNLAQTTSQLEKQCREMGEAITLRDRERAATAARLEELERRLVTAETERQRMAAELSVYEAAHTKADQIEAAAYRQAELIEKEALANAHRAREALDALLTETKTRYDGVRRGAEQTVAGVMGELDKAKAALSSANALFDGVSHRIDALRSDRLSAAPEFSDAP